MKLLPYLKRLIPVTACLSMSFLASCADSSSSNQPVNTQARTDSEQIFQEINRYRVANGKKPLIRNKGLDQLSRKHSQYLCSHVGSFSLHGKHVSHYGYESRVSIARSQFSMENMGENVGYASKPGNQPGPVLLQLWKNSSSHHSALLDDWTYTGVGTERGPNGEIYATQMFGTGNVSSHTAQRARFNSF